MPQATIHVLPRPYQAWIENGLLTRAGSVLAELLPQASRIFVVTVPPVRKRWGSKLLTSLKAAGFTPRSHRDARRRTCEAPGERSKPWRKSWRGWAPTARP